MNPVQEASTQLVQVLEELVKIYRGLLEVVRHERNILEGGRLDDLNESNRAKDAFLVRIRSLENLRLKRSRDLAVLKNGDADQPRLLELASLVEGEEGARLRSLHSVLDLLLKRLAEINKSNEELVQSALRTITGAMDAVKDSMKERPTYERKGSLASGKLEGGRLVRREA